MLEAAKVGLEKLHNRINDLEKQIHYKTMHISTLEDNQSKAIEFLQDMRSDTPGEWKELDNMIILLGAIPNPPLTFLRRGK